MAEKINHPQHYGGQDNPFEVIKLIERWGLDFCRGNAIKYICRAGKKDSIPIKEDIGKALWYVRRRQRFESSTRRTVDEISDAIEAHGLTGQLAVAFRFIVLDNCAAAALALETYLKDLK